MPAGVRDFSGQGLQALQAPGGERDVRALGREGEREMLSEAARRTSHHRTFTGDAESARGPLLSFHGAWGWVG